MRRPAARLAIAALLLPLTACGSSGGAAASTASAASTSSSSRPGSPSSSTAASSTSPPRAALSGAGTRTGSAAAAFVPAHVVVVVEENHSYADILSSTGAPYLHQLAAGGASLQHMYAVTHPSQPNYVAMFSGSTHGLTSDSCPHALSGPTLAGQLAAAHRTFVGWSEGLPAAGSAACTAGAYARKHAPWTDFPAVPASVGRPLSAFPTDFTTLPSVSFVIPNLNDDMHDGTITQADTWLRTHLGAYATWARTHDSLLVVTWDEDDHSAGNQIPTILYGAHVRTGAVLDGHADHYRVLRTIEWLYGLPGIGAAAGRTPLTGAFD